jgi:transposase-like protein
MKRYAKERKQAVLKRMMPPENTPVSVLVEDTGISDVTLYHWRKQARPKGFCRELAHFPSPAILSCPGFKSWVNNDQL